MLEEGDISFEDQHGLLNKLGKMCRQLKTIPDSMHIENCPTSETDEEYGGGGGTVSRGKYQGRPVAIKILHLYTTSNFEECFSVSAEISQVLYETLIVGSSEISQRSHSLETPKTPEYSTIYWCKS